MGKDFGNRPCDMGDSQSKVSGYHHTEKEWLQATTFKKGVYQKEKREITSPWYSNYERQSYAGTVSNGIGTSG